MTTRPGFLLLSSILTSVILTLSGCISQQVLSSFTDRDYSLNVHYDGTIEDSLKAGKYNWTYFEISAKNFASKESGTKLIQAALVQLNTYTTAQAMVKEQATAGLRPATLKELLAFGETYPEVQTKISVIGLGSFCDLTVETMEMFNMNPMLTISKNSTQMIMVRSVERLYPYLSQNMFGRSAVLMESKTVPKYHNPTLCGLFIKA